QAFERKGDLDNLMIDPEIAPQILAKELQLREVAHFSIDSGIPAPAYTASLAYLDGYRTARLPANFIQAQRDYFGAHTYERTDKPRGEFSHSNWTGQGGTTASTTYNA